MSARSRQMRPRRCPPAPTRRSPTAPRSTTRRAPSPIPSKIRPPSCPQRHSRRPRRSVGPRLPPKLPRPRSPIPFPPLLLARSSNDSRNWPRKSSSPDRTPPRCLPHPNSPVRRPRHPRHEGNLCSATTLHRSFPAPTEMSAFSTRNSLKGTRRTPSSKIGDTSSSRSRTSHHWLWRRWIAQPETTRRRFATRSTRRETSKSTRGKESSSAILGFLFHTLPRRSGLLKSNGSSGIPQL